MPDHVYRKGRFAVWAWQVDDVAGFRVGECDKNGEYDPFSDVDCGPKLSTLEAARAKADELAAMDELKAQIPPVVGTPEADPRAPNAYRPKSQAERLAEHEQTTKEKAAEFAKINRAFFGEAFGKLTEEERFWLQNMAEAF